MTDAARTFLQQALELEPDERAILAAELLTSLEESDDEVQRAWAAEIDRRSRHAAEGRGEDWRVVLDEIRADIFNVETRRHSPPRQRASRNHGLVSPGKSSGADRFVNEIFKTLEQVERFPAQANGFRTWRKALGDYRSLDFRITSCSRSSQIASRSSR